MKRRSSRISTGRPAVAAKAAKDSASLTSPGVRFDGRLPVLRGANRLGQDTRQVLREAGLDDSEIDALLRSGAARESSK